MMSATAWYFLCFAILELTIVSGRLCPKELREELKGRMQTSVQLEETGENDAAVSIVTVNGTFYPQGASALQGQSEISLYLNNIRNAEFDKMVHCESFEDDTIAIETSLFIADFDETSVWNPEHVRLLSMWKKIGGSWYADYFMDNYGPPAQTDEEFVNDETNV